MREILYRGKHTHTNEFKYGYLFYSKKNNSYTIGDGFNNYFVVPETIGQYTGLIDSKGTKIFEGDILKLKQPKDEMEYIARVVFGNPNGNYTFGWQLVFKEPFNLNTDILCWVGMECCGVASEVIGNIHDNPELLEVQND